MEPSSPVVDHKEWHELLKKWANQIRTKVKSGKDKLFSDLYFGDEVVEKLRCKAQQLEMSINTQTQSRFFIAVVQATMTGKTRLLMQLIRTNKKPVIMMRLLTRHNHAFRVLTKSIEDNNADRYTIRKLDYDGRRDHNRRIFLKIRLFFFCYMKFLELFLAALGKQSWDELDLEDRDVLNGLLLNGGADLLADLFTVELKEMDADRKRGNDLKQAKELLCKRHQQLAEKLGNPWFVLDECHTPQFYCKGILFHSDYKDKEREGMQEHLMRWQDYEMFVEEERMPPIGYEHASRTTLFSGFRSVVIEFLEQRRPQLTIFTSTYFSAWEPFLLKEKQSRTKPYVERFHDLYSLTIDDVAEAVCRTIQGF